MTAGGNVIRWQRDKEAGADYRDPKNRALHELFTATGGEVPAERTVRRALVSHEMSDLMAKPAWSNTEE